MRLTASLCLAAGLFAIASAMTAVASEDRVGATLPDDHVVANVEDHPITIGEIRRWVPGDRRPDTSNSSVEKEILDLLIDDFLIIRESRIVTASRITKRIVETELQLRLDAQFGGDPEKLAAHLRVINQTADEYRQGVRDELAVELARADRMAKIARQVAATEIDAFYAANLERFTHPDGVHFRLIKLSQPADEDLADLQQTADVVMKRLRVGEDFSALAKDYSQDRNRKSGGNMGWWARSDLRDELAEAAFALEPGRFSEPIRLDRDIFILFVVEKKRAGLAPLSEVRSEIETLLLSQRQREAEERWLTSLRSKAKIQVFP